MVMVLRHGAGPDINMSKAVAATFMMFLPMGTLLCGCPQGCSRSVSAVCPICKEM